MRKLSNFINGKSFSKSVNETRTFRDSNGILLARHLVAIDPTIFERHYPDNAFVNSDIWVDNSGGYANKLEKLRIEVKGGFALAGDKTTNKGDFKLSADMGDINVFEYQGKMKYTDTELKQAELGGWNVADKLISGVNKVYFQGIDEAIATGINGNEGLLNYKGFVTQSSSKINTLKPLEIDDLLTDFINSQFNDVNNTAEYMVNRVVLPIHVLNHIRTTKLSENAVNPITILQSLNQKYPDIKFFGSFRANDVDGQSVVSAFSISKDCMCVRIPLPMMFGTTQSDDNFGFVTPIKYRIGGVDIHENCAGRLLVGL